jgi:hypothetical protein
MGTTWSPLIVDDDPGVRQSSLGRIATVPIASCFAGAALRQRLLTELVGAIGGAGGVCSSWTEIPSNP